MPSSRSFGRRHARGRFEREDLQSNLTGAEWTDDEAFAAYGLDDATITALRAWAVEWADVLATESSKNPMIRTSTDRIRTRPHLQAADETDQLQEPSVTWTGYETRHHAASVHVEGCDNRGR
jgi:hypothetical protein